MDLITQASAGSSPRMRGAPIIPSAPNMLLRIIPAYAGSTPATCTACRASKDHPRVCGEHWSSPDEVRETGGSSPRMRGARSERAQCLVCDGIIPAYAGSTRRAIAPWPAWQDHPRVCGEHKLMSNGVAPVEGSSPRMRGAPAQNIHQAVFHGIIPAYAGSTRCPAGTGRPAGDHPRVCGEHLAGSRVYCCDEGSSPRMRGARTAMLTFQSLSRIIPAYAGSTGPGTPSEGPAGDHPRVCGEHFVFTF